MKIKIDIENKVASTSATKTMLTNAKILFGRNSTKIINILEFYSKERLVATNGIDTLLEALKTKETNALEKFAKGSQGKKLISNCLKLVNAKTPAKIFETLKAIKQTVTLAKLAGQDTEAMKRSQRTNGLRNKKRPPTGMIGPNRTLRKINSLEKAANISGVSVSKEYAANMPKATLSLLKKFITPTLANRIMNAAEEGVDGNEVALSLPKIKKLIDSLPSNWKDLDNLPDWVNAENEDSVTAFGDVDTGEIIGYYSPLSESAEFRISIMKENFDEPSTVSLKNI